MNGLKNILYVDDDEDVRLIVQIALSSFSHFNLDVCSSAQEALAVLPNKTPDLLLLDVMMPEMDGPSLLKEIRKRTDIENSPHIYITAKAQANDVISLLSDGALDVITKPFDTINLGDQIQNIWDKHHTNQPQQIS